MSQTVTITRSNPVSFVLAGAHVLSGCYRGKSTEEHDLLPEVMEHMDTCLLTWKRDGGIRGLRYGVELTLTGVIDADGEPVALATGVNCTCHAVTDATIIVREPEGGFPETSNFAQITTLFATMKGN